MNVNPYVKKLAESMLQRYANKDVALLECRRNIESPFTTSEGKQFWNWVLAEIEQAGESPSPS